LWKALDDWKLGGAAKTSIITVACLLPEFEVASSAPSSSRYAPCYGKRQCTLAQLPSPRAERLSKQNLASDVNIEYVSPVHDGSSQQHRHHIDFAQDASSSPESAWQQWPGGIRLPGCVAIQITRQVGASGC
jgi:hypothetical protein